MKVKLLPDTIEDGKVTGKQHFTCLLVDDLVAIDAGNIASSTTPDEKSVIRRIVLTHAHLDHIAGLPLFLDDLFGSLKEPVTVYALKEVIDVLENDIFNWEVYPRFSELENDHGKVLTYKKVVPEEPFAVEHLEFRAIPVNHNVPSVGYIVSDGRSTIALSGDTAEMDGFWPEVNSLDRLDALLVECAFPNRMADLAAVSHHFTPSTLAAELRKFEWNDFPVYVVNLKPAYREETVSEIAGLGIERLSVLEVGREYEF